MAQTMTISSMMYALYFKSVTRKTKKLHLGFNSVQFVGHELDSTGINITQKRIEGTIQLAQPNSLTELYSFLGLVNYFRDHSRAFFSGPAITRHGQGGR
jgi:hypothetical protein